MPPLDEVRARLPAAAPADKWKSKGKATTSSGWKRTEASKDVSTIPQGVQEAGPITRRVGLLLVKVISIVVLLGGLD